MELLLKNPELRELAERILRGLATEEDMQKAKPEDVRAIKTDNSTPHFRSMAEPLERVVTDPARSRRYVASDESVDRMGDIIRVTGWDFENFAKNPQALWGHNSRDFPIGTVSDWQKTRRNGKPVLLETINYLAEGTTPAADIVWKLVDQNVIRTVSVGFLPIESLWIDDPEERQKLGLGPWGVVYNKQEQLELSNCVIPANPNAFATKAVREALTEMVKEGKITERDAESIADLGARKTIVTVLELPEPPKQDEVPPEVPEDEMYFKMDDKGTLQRVRIVSVGAPPKAETPKPTATKSEPAAENDDALIPLEERMADLESAMEELTEEIRELPARLMEAVGPSFKDQKQILRTHFEAAIAKVGQYLSQEKV